jgi:hypothetical protein
VAAFEPGGRGDVGERADLVTWPDFATLDNYRR